MIILTHAISVNMFRRRGETLKIKMRSREEVMNVLRTERWISLIGRKDLSMLVSADLEMDVFCNRKPVKLREGDCLIVCQFVGPKIEVDGILEIDQDARLEYWAVEVL